LIGQFTLGWPGAQVTIRTQSQNSGHDLISPGAGRLFDKGQPHLSVRIINIKVDKCHRLPGSELQAARDHGQDRERRHERGQYVRAPVPAGPVRMLPPVVGGHQVRQHGQQVTVAARAELEHRDARRRMRDEHVQQAVAARGCLAGEVGGVQVAPLGVGDDRDPHLFIWYLGWTAHQLAALHSPFFTDVLQYPGGANLLWNTAVFAPIPIAIVSKPTAVAARSG